jgi:zinc transporter 9
MTDSPDFMPADRGFAAHVQDPRQSSVGDAQRDTAEGSHLLPPGRESTAPRQHKGIRQAFASIAGLIIHAAADGIAMGASAGSSDESLKLVVLFAIMIHKAPASFGLCTLLMGQRLHKSDIRRAVAIFSVATPTGAFLTYAFLSLLATKGNTSSEDTISPHHIGAALMFSAGTFLFVAMHAVQELASAAADADMEEEHHHRHHHNHHEEHHHPAHNSASPKQILGRTGRIAVFALGTILPKTMQIFVGHSH